MATRSESYRAEENLRRAKKNDSKPAARPKRGNGGHAEKSANVAREAPSANGKRSRMSSRRSKNRAKPDAPLEHAIAMKKGTPKAKATRARARAKRARGSS